MTIEELNNETMKWLGITEDDFGPVDDAKKIKTEEKKCPRCNGTGYIQSYKYHKGGICFKCNRNA